MVRIGEHTQGIRYLTDEKNKVYEFNSKEEAEIWLHSVKDTMTTEEINQNYFFEEATVYSEKNETNWNLDD